LTFDPFYTDDRKKNSNLGKPVWTTAGSAPRKELKKLIKLGVNGILLDQPKLLHSLLADMAKSCDPETSGIMPKVR
jgi:hypothetical protein